MKLRDILAEASLGTIGGEIFDLLKLSGPVDEDVFFELIADRGLHVKMGMASVHRLVIDALHAIAKIAQADTMTFYDKEVDIDLLEARLDELVYDVEQKQMFFKAYVELSVLPFTRFNETRKLDYYGIMVSGKLFSGNSGAIELKDEATVKAKLAKADVNMKELFLKSDEGARYFKLAPYNPGRAQ